MFPGQAPARLHAVGSAAAAGGGEASKASVAGIITAGPLVAPEPNCHRRRAGGGHGRRGYRLSIDINTRMQSMPFMRLLSISHIDAVVASLDRGGMLYIMHREHQR